jgi:excisionase family DNA binding protein
MPTVQTFLTIEEAANAARISKPTLYRRAKEGGLKITKLGHRSLISAADFERWMAGLPAKDDAQAA